MTWGFYYIALLLLDLTILFLDNSIINDSMTYGFYDWTILWPEGSITSLCYYLTWRFYYLTILYDLTILWLDSAITWLDDSIMSRFYLTILWLDDSITWRFHDLTLLDITTYRYFHGAFEHYSSEASIMLWDQPAGKYSVTLEPVASGAAAANSSCSMVCHRSCPQQKELPLAPELLEAVFVPCCHFLWMNWYELLQNCSKTNSET